MHSYLTFSEHEVLDLQLTIVCMYTDVPILMVSMIALLLPLQLMATILTVCITL